MKYLNIGLFLALQFACTPSYALRPSNIVFFNASTSATKSSAVIDAAFIMNGSIQASFSDGTAAGTLVLQCSNDVVSPTNWSTCANASNTATATVASGALTLISMQWLNSRWIRVSWTKSGGAGTFTVNGQFQAE